MDGWPCEGEQGFALCSNDLVQPRELVVREGVFDGGEIAWGSGDLGSVEPSSPQSV